ncbi:MAG TPA: peptidase M15 [Devosia sp.]|nr:peptidase M15 [Devosia sp.]
MRKPHSVKALEALGRVRLSENFFLRDFLYSEIAAINGFTNVPDDPDLAIAAGTALCETLLEPLQARFGRLSIRSAYRSPEVNQFGNEHKLNCAVNESNYAGHIWDRRDANGRMGATACIIVNRFIPYYQRTGDWEAMAWFVHDHLPYSDMEFFPKFAAFNLQWHEAPERSTYSSSPPGAAG